MSTDVTRGTSTLTDLEVLHRWAGRQLEKGRRDMPIAEAIERFEGYLEDAKRLRAELAESARGELTSADEAFDRIHRRIDEHARQVKVDD